MKRCLPYIIILYNVFLLTGCRDTLEIPEEEPRAEAERTVIVYMAADNSLSSQVREDTAEMVRGKNLIPENVNVIVYIDDRTHRPAIYELTRKNGMQLWHQYDEELCSTDRDVMLEALSRIEHYFPARHYGITFWSHATGWNPRRNTFGKDVTPGTTQGEAEMEIPVLRDVLAHMPKLDYIFFDACFMQCIEVAYELRDVTRYMIGSPAEIPGPGAPYDKVIQALCAGDVEGIIGGYDSGYPDTYNGYYYQGVLLSYIDCSQLDALAEATGQLLTPFFMEHTEPDTYGFQAYCNRLYKYNYYFDMRTTMCRLLSEEDYTAWMSLYDKAVPLRTYSSTRSWFSNDLCTHPYIDDPECYGGVSMFVPLDAYESYGWNADFQHTAWYEALGWAETGW
ncbi:MAG: hypothetical protein IJ537_00765 [Bacteroidaceae bacterium]|nr:hypothetical protein [Bacteroidaceae bacterium]